MLCMLHVHLPLLSIIKLHMFMQHTRQKQPYNCNLLTMSVHSPLWWCASYDRATKTETTSKEQATKKTNKKSYLKTALSKVKPRQRTTLSYGSRIAKLSSSRKAALKPPSFGTIINLSPIFSSLTSARPASSKPSKDFNWYVSSSPLFTALQQSKKGEQFRSMFCCQVLQGIHFQTK